MIQLQPSEYFTIVRQIPNHTDSSTYYVRAVIKNSLTDAIIATLNLTDLGSRRFKKAWQVPADVSGQGFYIDITTSVYTDSGYTTKSENYGDDNNSFLVQTRAKAGLGGGGGVDIDYKKIKKMLDTLSESIVSAFPKVKEVEITPILNALKSLESGLATLNDKEDKPDDLSPVVAQIKDLGASVIKEVKAQKPTTPDLSPILKKLDEIDGTEKILTAIEDSTNSIKNDIAEIEKCVDTMADGVDTVVKNTTPPPQKELTKQEKDAVRAAKFGFSVSTDRFNSLLKKHDQTV